MKRPAATALFLGLLALPVLDARGAAVSYLPPGLIEWSGDMSAGVSRAFEDVVRAHPNFRTLRMRDSRAGDPRVTRAVVDLVRRDGIAVEVEGACAASCAWVFLASDKRRFRPGTATKPTHVYLQPMAGRSAQELAREIVVRTNGKTSEAIALKAMNGGRYGGLMFSERELAGGGRVSLCRTLTGDKTTCEALPGETPEGLGFVAPAP